MLGDETAPPKSTVSRTCQQVKDEFSSFAQRDLSALRLDYLFLDGSNFKFHKHSPAEAVLCAWAPTPTASPTWWDWPHRPRSRPSPGVVLGGPHSPRSRRSAARRLRRRAGAHRGDRAGLLTLAAPSIACSTLSPRCPRPTRTPSRPTGGPSSTGPRSPRATRPSPKPAGGSTPSAPTGSAPTLCGRLSRRGLRATHRAPALPDRALGAVPARQFDRTHLWGDETAHQGDGTATGWAHLCRPRLRRARPARAEAGEP